MDFGLRSADLFFRELVVPELGRIWFARQISWPIAALALHKDLTGEGGKVPKPTTICHGIEALACKLEYKYDSHPDTSSRRILGTRAFRRENDQHQWAFNDLCQSSNYVRNTHRQAATRAIRVDGGLGFARGSRFDLLELEPVGHALANTFLDQRVGQGGMTLRRWLRGWLQGNREIPHHSNTLLQALSPEHPTADERAFVRSRLLGISTPASEKRRRLAAALGRAKALPDIERHVIARLQNTGFDRQAKDILAARAFGAMLDRARDVVALLTTDGFGIGRQPAKLTDLAADGNVKHAFKNLRVASTNYLAKADTADVNEPTSRSFANAVATADETDAIRFMVHRAGKVLVLADGSVVRGGLFRVVNRSNEDIDLEDSAASIEPDRTGRTFRIANLHALLRDVDPRGRQ